MKREQEPHGLSGLRQRVYGFYTRTGALLSAGLVVAVLALLALSTLSEEVLEGETTAFDTRWMVWLDERSTPWLDRAAVEATALGSGVVVFTIAVVAVTILLLSNRRRYAVLVGGAVAGAAILNPILKLVFNRPRPQLIGWRVEYADLPSYPSGHATSATVLFLVLGYVVYRLGSGRRSLSVAITVVAGLVPVVVGLSRIYLGVHYPTDVLASFATGFVWTVFAVYVTDRGGPPSRSHESVRGDDPDIRSGDSDPDIYRRNMMNRKHAIIAVASFALAACGEGQAEVPPADMASASATAPEAAATCEIDGSVVRLPDEVRETSGLARSRVDGTLFWTHNDAGNDPALYAIGADGQVRSRVAVAGAQLEDWEDIEAAACGSGDCLFIGDIGDNDGDRREVVIYRVEEPAPGATATSPATPIRARFADEPQDAEALFVLPDGDAYIVTKGRTGPIRLYRLDDAATTTDAGTFAFVAELFPEPENEDDRVTGAGATPNGAWVAIRTYRNLYLYPASDLVSGVASSPSVIDISSLDESQGESVTIADDGSVWMTSEAAGNDDQPQLSMVQCALGG